MEPRTLCDLFYSSVDVFRKPAHLKHKKDGVWHAISSDDLRRAVEEISMGLRVLGVEKGDRVALLSENRPEWAMVDLATLTAGAADVPIYPSLTGEQVLYILNDSEARVCFASTPAQLRKLAEVREKAPALKHVVRLDPEAEPAEGTLTLEEVREKGRQALAGDTSAVRKRAAEVRPEDLATIIYTSGTTGEPKGVMLTHANLVFNVLAAASTFQGHMGSGDTALSFLPLCHVFERMGGYYLMLHYGVTIAYAEGVEQVAANMGEVQPAVMCSVPRLYEKMYARINEKVASDPPKKQKIFRWALGVGRQMFDHRVRKTAAPLLLRIKHAVADKLVFSKIKARTGGKLRLFVSGGAPLSREIAEFFGAAGLTILEGYGLTETSPVITVNRMDDLRPGTVGKLIPGVEVKIAADGEILTRGPHVMTGYYRKPEATREAIDADGWFHTGDIGVLDTDGFLTITDRKKDLIVTSGGKNIAPQPIENLIKTHPLIGEIVMIGNERHFPAALVVPNFETLGKWARERGIPLDSREDLVRRREVEELYETTVKELTAGLAQFERIKKIALLATEFTQESGELTPTLKVKRRVVEQKYREVIDRLYEGAAA